MFNGKYTNLSRVLENIARDTGYDNNLYRDDAKEWAIRAMNLIGVNLPYDHVIETKTVENFRTEIPTTLVELIGIRDAKTKESLSSSTDDFIISLEDQTVANVTTPAGKTAEETVIPSYKIVNGYIFFNFESGDVEISYTKYTLDDNGCLMIPDVDRYLMAVEAYIIHKIDSKLYRRGMIPRDVKMESEQNWLWYVNSAANKLITPNYDVAENLSRMAQRIRPAKDSHSTQFKTLNYPTVKRF